MASASKIIVTEEVEPFVIQHSDVTVSDEIIGRGGAGIVYLGIYNLNGTKVAVKVIFDDSEEGIMGYQREAFNLSQNQNPFLINFIGFTTSKPYWLVTKYMPNGTLSDALHEDTHHLHLNPTEISFIAYGIASGMQYLHNQDVIHRDLKAQNILLDENKYPSICDFGSSKYIARSNPKTGLVGTAQYMAPECFGDQPYTEKADVYSYGALVWEMVTREVPFGQFETVQLIYHILFEQGSLPIPECPAPLKSLIRHCLDRDPQKRPTFDTIVQKFKSGKLYFEGTDQAKLQHLIFPQLYAYQKKSQKTNSMNDMIMQSLSSLVSLNEKQAESALQFLCENSAAIQFVSIDFWTPLLTYSMSHPENQQINEVFKALLQNQESYSPIDQVRGLHKFVSIGTLIVFLYVVKFSPHLITMEIVDQLISLAITYETNPKPLILLVKILTSQPKQSFMDRILSFFATHVKQFVNREGGDLMLHQLALANKLQQSTITLYSTSTNPKNVIASYQCVFALKSPPSVFLLNTVLRHVVCDNCQVRNEALEFLRVYGTVARGNPLLQIVYSLIIAVEKYGCEKSALLLCRFASDTIMSDAFLHPDIMPMWLKVSPNRVTLLVTLFILVVSRHPELMDQKDAVAFVSIALHSRDPDTFITACWLVGKLTMNSVIATKLNATDLICERIIQANDPIFIETATKTLTSLARYTKSKLFPQVAGKILKFINQTKETKISCFTALVSLSLHNETHQALIDANVVATLAKFRKDPDILPFIVSIMGHLRANDPTFGSASFSNY